MDFGHGEGVGVWSGFSFSQKWVLGAITNSTRASEKLANKTPNFK